MAGNTSEKTTLKAFLDKIEKQYGRAKRVWVMDRGIPTEQQLKEMREAVPPVAYLVGTPRGRLSKRHLSRKLCLRDSCRGLETGLEYGIELVKHGGDIPGQAFPSTLLERRNGKAQLEL